MSKKRCRATRAILALIAAATSLLVTTPTHPAQKIRMAYISDSPGSAAPYWIAKEAGL